MIASLEGKVAEKLPSETILDVNGVGYGLILTVEDEAQLKIGEKSKLYVHEHIRENSHDLYGFIKLDTKQLFEKLLDVNGVGPKMALEILNIGSSQDVRKAIAGGDVKFLQTASGVGRRVAERVVVDLKDKIGIVSSDGALTDILSPAAVKKDEAIQALVALGYSTADAAQALSGVSNDISTEDRVKQALKAGVK